MPEPLRQVYQIYIRTTPEKLWDAITDPAKTSRYFYETAVESTWKKGGPLNRRRADGSMVLEGEVLPDSFANRGAYAGGPMTI